MNSSRTRARTTEEPRSGTDRARSAVPNAPAWLAVVAVAVFPFPWWW